MARATKTVELTCRMPCMTVRWRMRALSLFSLGQVVKERLSGRRKMLPVVPRARATNPEEFCLRMNALKRLRRTHGPWATRTSERIFLKEGVRIIYVS